jgi:hypothetical protein
LPSHAVLSHQFQKSVADAPGDHAVHREPPQACGAERARLTTALRQRFAS